MKNKIQHIVEHLSKVEFEDQITANIMEVHMFTRTFLQNRLHPELQEGGGGLKDIGCNRRANECQCGSIVTRYCAVAACLTDIVAVE